MINRADFIFTVGYEGNAAIVDKSLKRRYGRFSTRELAEKGLLKAALCSALYSQKADEFELVLQAYNEKTTHKVRSIEELKRTYGVNEIPHKVVKVTYI